MKLDKLMDTLKDELEQHTLRIANGAAHDYADYRELVGFVKAYEHILATIREVAGQPEEDE